jgi:hypothetical protein
MNIDRQQQQQQQFYSLDDPTPGFVLNDFSTEVHIIISTNYC